MENFSNTHNYEAFEIISVVDKGGYATSLIQDPFSGKRYVKKELAAEKLPIYQKLQTLKHQGLAEIVEIIQEHNKITVIIEYATGETLKSILDHKIKLDEKVAINYTQQLSSILNVVHQNGIIHRDITPNNIIVATNGQIKLIDFDIARFYKNSQTEDTQFLGTPGYAAPEQFGFEQSTASSDIYALGVLLNVMLTGMKPNEMQIKDESLALIVKNCTAMDQSLRYQDVMQLGYDLRRWFMPTPPHPQKEILPISRTSKAFKMISALIIFSLIALIVLRFLDGNNDYLPILTGPDSNTEHTFTQDDFIGKWQNGSGDMLRCPLCNLVDEIEFLENNTVVLNDEFRERVEIWQFDGNHLHIANSEYRIEINEHILTISDVDRDRSRMWIRADH